MGCLLLEDGTALLVVGPCHQDSLVPQAIRPLEEFLEGCVRLDKIVGRQMHAQPLLEVLDTLRLVLAAAVSEQDERDVVLVEELQDLRRARDRLGDMKQNSVDAVPCQSTHPTFFILLKN